MANEVTISARLVALKNGIPVDSGSLYKQRDMTGSALLQITQDAAVAAAQLIVGPDVTTIGDLLVLNTGIDGSQVATAATVSLSYSSNGTSPFLTIAAGKFALFQPTSATIYVTCSSGTVKVATTLVEA